MPPTAHTVVSILQSAASAFFRADGNADTKLDFEEFCTSIPPDIAKHTCRDTLREIFDLADTNHDGEIDREEYFMWTLRWTSAHAGVGSGVEDAFRRYDKTGDGKLDLREFCNAVDEFGFGSIAPAVFEELDKDESGTISYAELIEGIRAQHRGAYSYSDDCKRVLTQMSFQVVKCQAAGEPKDVALDTAEWNASSPDDVRVTIAARMLDAKARPFDVWAVLLRSVHAGRRAHGLTQPRFRTALRDALGYAGDDAIADAAFAVMDDDSSGEVTFDEFLNFVNGKPQRRRLSRELRLSDGRGEKAQPLEEIEWTEVILHYELYTALKRAGLSALDLLSAYDGSDDSTLSKREFLFMVKSILATPTVWRESNIKDVCIEVFSKLAGTDHELSIDEMHGWMLKGTHALHHPVPGGSLPAARDHRPTCRPKSASGSHRKESGLNGNIGKRPVATPSEALPQLTPDPGHLISSHLINGGTVTELRGPSHRASTPALRHARSRAEIALTKASLASKKADEALRNRLMIRESANRVAAELEAERQRLERTTFESHREQQSRKRLMQEQARRSMFSNALSAHRRRQSAISQERYSLLSRTLSQGLG